MIRELRKNKLVKVSFDLRITVATLVVLMVLTTWGTLYQKWEGLYASQERFFFSWWVMARVDVPSMLELFNGMIWYFKLLLVALIPLTHIALAFGMQWSAKRIGLCYGLLGALLIVWGFGLPVPVPGGQLCMWILFLNLSASAIFRFGFRWSQSGILLTHFGLIFLLVGSFITHYYAIESNLALEEGEASNVASHYHEWEIAFWPKAEGETRQVTAQSVKEKMKGQTLKFADAGITVTIDEYFTNCDNVEAGGDLSGGDRKNGAFEALQKLKPDTEPERNLPAGMFDVNGEKLLLYGAINRAIDVTVDEIVYELQLRRRRIPLPFTVTLLDFVKEEHAGTTMAKNYESTVHLEYEVERDVRIFMNNPLRYDTFTFYQSSFSQTQAGGEISVFAVVDNSGRLIPYISSGIIFGGLLVHFIVMFVQRATPRIRRRLET